MAAELSLEALREEIDKIDEVIVRLLDRRARCAYSIGRLKKEQGATIYEPQREAAVMAHIKQVNAMLGGPLDEGQRDGDTVVCPWHGSRFDLRDGAVLEGPAVFSQPAYDTRVVGGQVEIRTRDSA